MNRITFLSTAVAIAAAFVQPAEAKDHGGGGRGGGKGGGGGGGKPQAAPKSAPRSVARSPGRSFNAPRARVQTPSRIGRSPGIVKQRDFRPQTRRAPSIAFGGSTVNKNVERRTNIQNRTNIRSFNNRTVVNNDNRRWNPPGDVYRNWDRRHEHTWNNHRYHWRNNNWVIIGGYAPYYYSSAPYYNDDYDYDYTPSAVAEFAPTSNLAIEVQEELGRRGYDTGGTDGVIGPQTRNAISAFQADNGLAVTGRIDQSLLRELGI